MQDVKWLASKLGNVQALIQIPDYNHDGMVHGSNAKEVLYDQIFRLLPPPWRWFSFIGADNFLFLFFFFFRKVWLLLVLWKIVKPCRLNVQQLFCLSENFSFNCGCINADLFCTKRKERRELRSPDLRRWIGSLVLIKRICWIAECWLM